MNLLIDRLPDTVMIGGTEYRINTDFRASILFELMIRDDDLTATEKAAAAVQLYFEDYPHGESVEDVFHAIIWFYRCGRTDKEPKKDDQEERPPRERQYFSYDYDDEYIYAAFLQQYQIDLTRADLHWWEFTALFKALDENCEICKIMGYRAAKITSKMSRQEKDFLRKMKRIHALPVPEKEQEETEAIVDALMNGGDLTGILG